MSFLSDARTPAAICSSSGDLSAAPTRPSSRLGHEVAYAEPTSYVPYPSIVCKREPPFVVVYANSQWEELCGWNAAEMLGGDLRCLQGPATEQTSIGRMLASCRKGEAHLI